MPKVGNRSFPYNETGMSQAQKEAKRTGLPMEQDDRHYQQYAHGGSVAGVSRGGGAATRGLSHRVSPDKPKKFSGGGPVRTATKGAGRAKQGATHLDGIQQARSLNPEGNKKSPQETSTKRYGK